MAFLSRNLILDLLLTALAPAIWGTTYIVTSQFLPPDRPFIAALLRVLPAGIALLIWSRRFPQRREWAKLIVTGILNIGAFQALLFIAAYRLPGGLAAVIGAIQPLLVMLLAWCVDRQRSPWLAVFSAIAGILGMAMLLLSPHTVLDPLGIGAAFLGAISMALGTWLSRRWALSLPIVALTGWQLTIGGVVLAPVALIVDPPLHQVTVLQAAGYLWLCLAGAMLAYGLWFRGIGRLTGGRVGDESAEPGDRRGTGMDIPRTKDPGDGADGIDRGAGERDVYPARAGASGGGSKNEKAP